MGWTIYNMELPWTLQASPCPRLEWLLPIFCAGFPVVSLVSVLGLISRFRLVR